MQNMRRRIASCLMNALEGGNRANLPVWTEENRRIPEPVSIPRVEPTTFQMRVHSVAAYSNS
jgi:hypothetical protein